MEQLIQFLKCIADETRLKLLKLLLDQKLCVCELTAILEKSQPCISQHLRRFKELDLVTEERSLQWSYFQINLDVYQRNLQLLNQLKDLDYENFGLTDLETKDTKDKQAKLCN